MAKLYIVGTPIGNMGDLTFRAAEVLKSADVIACEDTRRSMPLLKKYDVHAKLIAYHKFNEKECASKLVDLISEGKNVALITDAGMPSISDPGAEIISECREKGIETETVPGPTALATAVALSGIKASGFIFLGFLPENKGDKTRIVSKADKAELPIVLYVAPHDLKKTATFLLSVLGNRKVYVVRELTKIHECCTITSLASFESEERGEIVMIVEAAEAKADFSDLSIEEQVRGYLSEGMDKKDAIKKTASERGVPKNEVYKQVMDL